MRVQHNITALNAYRNFNTNNSQLGANLEKLSSGYKINRAGDNAAGLAISEKMRAQITGLDVAQRNAKDGISLVQTAEGALTEVHDMLNRMYELSEQSANGTFADEVDREQLQKEVNQLRTEINRIADSANFNGINLLDGSLSTSAVGDATSVELSSNLTAKEVNARAGLYTLAGSNGNQVTLIKASATSVALAEGDTFTVTVSYTDADGNEKTVEKTFGFDAKAANSKVRLIEGSAGYQLKALDGTTDLKNAAASKVSKAEMSKIVGAALNTDEDFAAVFTAVGEVKTTGSFAAAIATGAISFLAKDTGANGAAITGITLTHTTKTGTDYVTEDILNPAFKSIKTVIDPVDETDVYDLSGSSYVITSKSSAAAAAKEVSDKAFEVNGHKFAFVQKDALNAVDLAAIKAAGVTTVEISSASAVAADVTKMVAKIKEVTGLDVAQGSYTATPGSNNEYTATTKDLETTFTGTKVSTFAENNTGTFVRFSAKENAKAAGSALTLQIGDTADSFNKMQVEIADTHTTSLGIKDKNGKVTSSLSDVDISTQDGAGAACDVLKAAINQVSDVRGGLGAIQNRLEHTINNLGVMQENIQNAESLIRDTDVAEEMMKFTKNSIMNQAAQAMLAQANQLPQGVLQLLQ